MVGAQLFLALLCALLGLAAPAVLIPLGRIAAGTFSSPSLLGPVWTLPMPLLALLLGVSLTALAAWMSALAHSRPARRFITWECGFGDLGPRTQYTATSFAQPIARMFGTVYGYSVKLTVEGRDRRHFPDKVLVEPAHEPYLETRVYAPLLKLIQQAAGTLVMRLQAGSIHQYLLYMALALGALLWLGYRS
jgi:hypothetical protein